jgi:hypothetical protein
VNALSRKREQYLENAVAATNNAAETVEAFVKEHSAPLAYFGSSESCLQSGSDYFPANSVHQQIQVLIFDVVAALFVLNTALTINNNLLASGGNAQEVANTMHNEDGVFTTNAETFDKLYVADAASEQLTVFIKGTTASLPQLRNFLGAMPQMRSLS